MPIMRNRKRKAHDSGDNGMKYLPFIFGFFTVVLVIFALYKIYESGGYR